MIESKRLYLRNWRPEDAAALYKYASDRRVSELALWPCHESEEMSREVIENVFAPNPHAYAMVLKATEEPIGCVGLVPQGYENHPTEAAEREVGYWVGFPYWGQGLTSEALACLIEHLRETTDIQSFLITTDKRNVASQRVAEKCGFAFVEDYINDGIESKAYRLGSEQRGDAVIS